MPELRPIQFGAQHAEGRSPMVSVEDLQNLYVEKNPNGNKGAVTLHGTPGLTLLAAVGNGPIRGMHRMGAYLYVVSGNELYRVDSAYNSTNIGEIKGSGHVFMTENGTHVAICSSKHAYAANIDGLTELAEQYLNSATYQDGYGIFTQAGTENFWITALDDMTSISALDFSTADAFPDTVVGCISDHRELWVFGKTSTEVWHNVGAAAFPFARSGSGFMERGCASGASIAKAQNAVFWLGDDLRVYMASGYTPKPISNSWVDKTILAENSPQTAVGFTYDQEGHTFYVLSFQSKTLVFDLSTGRWHTRKSEDIGRWRANGYSWVWNKHVVGDYSNGNIYELDLDVYSDNGDPIERMSVSPPLFANSQLLSTSEIYLDIDMGVGLTSGQGSAPLVMLSWSDDGGRTWANERTATMGPIGNYKYRARWHRLGTDRHRVYRISVTDPVKVAISGAYARIERMAA